MPGLTRVLKHMRHMIDVILLLAVSLAACGREAANDGQLLVVVSILPLADFTRQVGGDRVQVETLVPPGASPHTYELVPAQLEIVSRARVMILNGVGLEYWADKVIAAAKNPDLLVVITSDGLEILADDTREAAGNPHVWLSPRNAEHQVGMIREALIQADPQGVEIYRANTDRYLAELRALDQDLQAAVAACRNQKFIAFHAAWAYLARDYGLEQVAVVETMPGREPSPAEMAAIIQTARAIGAQAIFAEPQFPSNLAKVIADESGAQVLFLDPLGQPPDYCYLDLMRFNLNEISQALR